MNKKLVLGAVVAALAVVAVTPVMAEERVTASEKGSLLVFAKVDIRWDAAGNLIQDTFISLTNDYPADVQVQMYFVNGDGCYRHDLESGNGYEPSCNSVDVGIYLTQNEPTYWSAVTGMPKGVSPFTILDPAQNGNPPGRPDPDGSGDWVLRGYVIAWAVNANGVEIRWNHLTGEAMIVNYLNGSAWEYNAYAFQAAGTGTNGAALGTPGDLFLNGQEYEQGFDLLLLDFYASGANAFNGSIPVTVDTDLALLPMNINVEQETPGPTTTKASFTVWNMNETKLTGMDRCVTCWDSALVSGYGVPNHFLRANLQTDKGKAQIDGLASVLCNYDADDDDGLALGADPDDIVSTASSLLGVASKRLSFSRGADYAEAGTTLVGMGLQSATILTDVTISPPPEKPNAVSQVKQTVTRQVGTAVPQ